MTRPEAARLEVCLPLAIPFWYLAGKLPSAFPWVPRCLTWCLTGRGDLTAFAPLLRHPASVVIQAALSSDLSGPPHGNQQTGFARQ